MTKCQSLWTGILFVDNATFPCSVIPGLIGTLTPKNDTQILPVFCVTTGRTGCFASKLTMSRKNRLFFA